MALTLGMLQGCWRVRLTCTLAWDLSALAGWLVEALTAMDATDLVLHDSPLGRALRLGSLVHWIGKACLLWKDGP